MSIPSSVSRRRTAVIWSVVVAFALVAHAPARAHQGGARLPRVRSDVSVINTAIARGHERSPTFRRLVETIDNSDGIVHVEEGQCGMSVRACLQLWIGVAGPNRFLRIRVNPRKAPGCELVVALGHELQHAIEVLSNPKIRDSLGMFNLFDQNRRSLYGTFETNVAVQVGLTIDREIC